MSATVSVPSPAERLLLAASRLFPLHGIRAVGIDQIIADAGVAKASLYQAFGSKDALVVAYLERQDTADRAAYRAAIADLSEPIDRVLISFDLAEAAARRRSYRGCLFLNAAAEFPDPGHPIADAVQAHRAWLRARWAEALVGRPATDPEGQGADPDGQGADPGGPAEMVWRVQVLYDGGVAGAKATRSVAPIVLARQMAHELLSKPGRADSL